MKWLNEVVCKFIYPSKLCFHDDQEGGLAAFPTKGSNTFEDIFNIDALSSETFLVTPVFTRDLPFCLQMWIDKRIWTHGANVQQLLQFMAALSPSVLPWPKYTENETVKGLLLESLTAQSLLLKLGSAWSSLQLWWLCGVGRERSCLFCGLKVMCSGNCWGLMREAEKLCEKMENAIAACSREALGFASVVVKGNTCFNPGVHPASYWLCWCFWSLNVLVRALLFHLRDLVFSFCSFCRAP